MKTIPLAGCVIQNSAGEILLLHRNTTGLVQWELPGGKVEPSEDCEAAAIRELQEETSLKVKIIKKLGVANFELRDSKCEYHWFLARIIDGTPSILEAKFDEIKYQNLSEMAESELSANLLNLLSAIKSGAVTL